MARWLKAHTALPEDSGSAPHWVAHLLLSLTGSPAPSFGLHRNCIHVHKPTRRRACARSRAHAHNNDDIELKNKHIKIQDVIRESKRHMIIGTDVRNLLERTQYPLIIK